MTLEEFVFDLPLYQKIDAKNGYDDIIALLEKADESVSVEGYNSFKKKNTTYYILKGICSLREYYDFSKNSAEEEEFYVVKDNFINAPQLMNEIGVKSIILKCRRYGDTIAIDLYYNYEEKILMKVGQYPSVADIHIGQVKQYDKVLEKPILREFTKAIGLAANGVGIGSYVYLRRIFENLVFQAFDEAKKDGAAIDHFESMRMEEKIKVLKGYLPSFIVENNSIYGILSKGIHELTEEDCLAYFDCMRQSIELILDERLVQLEKKKKIDEVKKTLNTITSQIKK